MRKIVERMGALMRRRKPSGGKDEPGLMVDAAAAGDAEPSADAVSPPKLLGDPSPELAQAVPEPAPVVGAVPVPARRERAPRSAPDLVLMFSGKPGQPGIDLSCVHADTGYRLRENYPEALYPDEVEGGDYILDVTGHALAFGPQGRPGAHVFVPVKTHKGSPSSMPRNAAGNALVPIDARIVERIDRETAAVKVRLQRPVVAWVSLRGGEVPLLAEAQAVDEPHVEVFEDSKVEPPVAEGRDVAQGSVGGPAAGTDAERRARDDLSAMGFLLAHQAVAPQGGIARTDDAPAPADAEAGGKGEEWSPVGAYAR